MCLKQKGRDLLTLHHRHGHALNETLAGTPDWACFAKRRSLSRNCPFRDEQQPKLREMILVKLVFWSLVYYSDAASLRKEATRDKHGDFLMLSDYALVSRILLRRRFGLDITVAERESQLYKTYVEFFSQVRENPGARKGLLRLTL